jgi:hypothetical protein
LLLICSLLARSALPASGNSCFININLIFLKPVQCYEALDPVGGYLPSQNLGKWFHTSSFSQPMCHNVSEHYYNILDTIASAYLHLQ